MGYHQIAYLHLAIILPAFLIGTYLLLRRKGTPTHRRLGRVYMLLMLVTGVLTLFMPAEVGPRFLGHFGYLHILSVVTIITVPVSYHAARTHNVPRHRRSMLILYAGGILVAGSFALMPGRLLHDWLAAAPAWF